MRLGFSGHLTRRLVSKGPASLDSSQGPSADGLRAREEAIGSSARRPLLSPFDLYFFLCCVEGDCVGPAWLRTLGAPLLLTPAVLFDDHLPRAGPLAKADPA